jgi:hypothetical protein
MGKVDEAYSKWLRYAGYQKPKLPFDKYHKVVQGLSPSELLELNKKITKRQRRQERTLLRGMRRR